MGTITLQTFFVGLMLTSALTGLVTEAVKKILTEHNKTYHGNTLTGLVATVLSAVLSVGYIIFTNAGFTSQTIICIIAMIFLSWLCAMVGYDKVAQTITQIKSPKKED